MKLYIHNKPFKYSELINYKNLKNYDFKLKDINNEDLLMIVSKDVLPNNYFNIPVFKNIKNKFYFVDTPKVGTLIEESRFMIGNKSFYIYKLNRKEYKQNTRQKHGFLYELEIIDLNHLRNLPNVAKWDAYGDLDKNFLDKRLEIGKQIYYYDYGNSLNIENIDSWDLISNKFRKEHFWSIKCMADRTDIELGDFKRISGLSIDSNGNIVHKKTDIEDFFMMVSFHDNTQTKEIIEEYLIYFDVKSWESYLPKKLFEIEDNEPLFIKMYRELNEHRLIGERTKSTEEKWNIFTNKYRKLSDSIIKLRFKRDTKGQLRIQSAISYNSFKNIILKNPHIKILLN
jgi:hypothetical protein